MSDLNWFLENGTQGFEPSTDWLEHTLRRVRRRERNRKVIAGVVALLIAVGVGTGLALALAGGSRLLPVRPHPTQPTVNGPNGMIAFLEIVDKSDGEAVFVINPDGSGRRRLTPGPDFFGTGLSWSPDGRQLVFNHAISDAPPNWELDVANADGSGIQRITEDPSLVYHSVAWSPDGTRMAFETGNGRLAVMDLNGKHVHEVPGLPSRCTEDGASWSPDGTQLVYELTCQHSSSIEVVGFDGTGRRTLIGPTPPPEGNGPPKYRSPVWSPDGEHIAFVQGDVSPSGDQTTDVYVMNADGSRVHKLPEDGKVIGAVWSPDGTRIAFLSYQTGIVQIWVMNADGTDQKQLTHETGDVPALAWQPLPLTTASSTPTPRPTKSPRPSPSASASAARCVTGRSTGRYAPPGEITVCPSEGPVASLVTISGQGCGIPGDTSVLVVFLGPTDYIGTGGAGVEIRLPVDRSGHFHGTFRIPANYTGGGNNANPELPTRPGLYHFATYPAGACFVNFTVTAH